MKKLLLFSVAAWLLCASCSQKILIQEAYQIDTEKVDNQSRIDVRTYYAGDGIDIISFQIDVDNRSDGYIELSERNIELRVESQGSRETVMRPIYKKKLIADLAFEERQLGIEKKANTISNVILAGASIFSGILGGSPVDNVIIGTDAAIGIIDTRSRFGAAQGSIKEQIAYHEEYTLEEARIPAGRSGSYDVHFPRLLTNSNCELMIVIEGKEYSTRYELEVKELKVRR